MSKQKVFLIGATGETGSDILEALIKDGSFDIICFIRTVSAGKPSVQRLKDRGLKVVTGDLTGPYDEIVALLQGIDIVISGIFPEHITQQIPLIDAAAQAGVKRFVPCNWATPAPRGGVMAIRDTKEEVHDHIFRHYLGFTIIDVGYWYQASLPGVPSGKLDYAIFLSQNELHVGGTTPNMLIDMRDVGPLTVRIIKDERTLNKRVIVYGEVLNENEIYNIVEKKTGEKIEYTPKSAEEIRATVEAAKEAQRADPSKLENVYKRVIAEYNDTKYVRADNTPESAEYLGYINGRELYPDYEYIKFADFVDEVVAGKAKRPYPHLKF